MVTYNVASTSHTALLDYHVTETNTVRVTASFGALPLDVLPNRRIATKPRRVMVASSVATPPQVMIPRICCGAHSHISLPTASMNTLLHTKTTTTPIDVPIHYDIEAAIVDNPHNTVTYTGENNVVYGRMLTMRYSGAEIIPETTNRSTTLSQHT